MTAEIQRYNVRFLSTGGFVFTSVFYFSETFDLITKRGNFFESAAIVKKATKLRNPAIANELTVTYLIKIPARLHPKEQITRDRTPLIFFIILLYLKIIRLTAQRISETAITMFTSFV